MQVIHKTLLVAATLFSSSFAFSADVNKIPWQMYQQNADHTGFVDCTLDKKNFKLSWKAYIGDQADSGLNYSIPGVVVEGNFVIASRSNYVYSNTLQAFSLRDGSELWKKSYGEPSVNPPTIVNGSVYVQTVNNSLGGTALYAYKAKTGDTIFQSPTSAQWDQYLNPTFFDNNIYLNGGSYGGMYSFKSDMTGQQNWFTPLAQFDMWTPAVNKKYAVAYTDGQLNVLDRLTGKVIENIADPHYQWSGYSANFAPTFVSQDKVVGIQSGYVTVYSIEDKKILWSIGPGFSGQPSFDNQYIYAAQNNGLVVLDPSTGKIIWKWFKDNETVLGQNIITKNLIFVATNKQIYAISKINHKEIWSYSATGQMSLGMGYLFVVEHSGNLHAIKIS